MTPHPSAERLAAFLDDRLTPDEREEAVRHFAECTSCRQELTELRRLLPTASPRPHWRWAAGAVAAALILAVGLPRLARDVASDVSSGAEGIRAGEERESIMVSAPANATTMSAPFTFTWHSVGVNATYLVVVQDSAGNVLVRTPTSDTSVALPPSTQLNPGSRYFWSVDARRASGQSLRSTVHSFRVR